MKCYLSRNYKGLSNAGNKAKTDIEQVMQQNGFKNVGLTQTQHTQPILAFIYTLLGVLKFPFCLQKGDFLVLQYPLKKYFTFICFMAHCRKAKVIVVIHDLGSFRRKKLTASKEVKRLSHADYIISHNEKMKKWLEDHHCLVPIGELGIFDFLSQSQIQTKPVETPYKVIYAGGLSPRKNSFLYEIGSHIHSYQFYLYGNGFEIEKAKGKEHLKYMGFTSADQLVANPQGHFGLVWDGHSIDTCTGNFGEYLQYNNPHKTSLYLRSGLPVIIWERAALSSFILKHNVGFVVKSLAEIDSILSSITPEEYKQMKENAIRIGALLANGHFITQALSETFQKLNNQADSPLNPVINNETL